MKVKDLAKKAEGEIKEEKELVAIERLKDMLYEIEAAKTVSARLEDRYEKFLEKDVSVFLLES